MSINVVHEEIKRFLENKTPEVLCLKGKWGVGKTYTWNQYLKEIADKNKLALDKYAYVSLFGLNSLDDVKFAIFESTTNGGDPTKKPTVDTLKKNFGWLNKFYKKGVALVSQNPFIQSYIGNTGKSLFFFVRNQIVCIDDLERAGENLTTKDIFGLISFLKEQRKCKVVLILNDEKLEEAEKTDYLKLLEKVVDTKLDFSPTAEEAADVVFPNPSGIALKMRDNCVALGINNIRVIKKIERIVSRFEEIFGKDSKLMKQVAHSSALFAWSVYQPDDAPPMDFLKDFARIYGLGHEKDKTPEKERNWQGLIREYGYLSTDEFDSVILKTIENGYFDTENLKAAGQKQIGLIDEAGTKQGFENAWSLYHNSFDDNEKEVLDALYDSAKKASKLIEPINLDSTVRLLKEFGRTNDALALIKHYIEARSNEKDLFNFERSIFSREIKDPDLIEAFKMKRDSFVDSRDVTQLLEDICTNHGWNPDDIVLLNKLSMDDFYNIFKKTKELKLHKVIRTALDFGKFDNASDEMKSISKNAILALQRIAKENKLNEKRVATHGIKVEKENEKEKIQTTTTA